MLGGNENTIVLTDEIYGRCFKKYYFCFLLVLFNAYLEHFCLICYKKLLKEKKLCPNHSRTFRFDYQIFCGWSIV